MKTLVAVLILLSASLAQSETFFAPTSSTNRLMVASNEVVLIHWSSAAILGTIVHQGRVRPFGITRSGVGGIPNRPSYPIAITGDAELIITNQTVVSLKRLSGAGMKTVWMELDGPTNHVSIAQGQSIRLFDPIFTGSYPPISISKPGFTNGFVLSPELNSALELEGPLNLAFPPPSGWNSSHYALIVYLITDSAQTLHQQGVIQGPTGDFRILVERSGDMTNWVTSSIINLSDDQRQFYRFRIGK